MKPILYTFALLALFSCGNSQKTDTKLPASPPVAPTIPQLSTDKIEIPVRILPTEDGSLVDGDAMNYQYLKTTILPDKADWGDRIEAYGTAYKVWFGLKGWTGESLVGVDGNIVLTLHPTETKNGSYISYYEAPACVGCILRAAAEYFPDAMAEYNKSYNSDGQWPVAIRKGLKVVHPSASIALFTLPEQNGLLTKGVAIYTGQEDYREATFVLPEKDMDIADFIIRKYIEESGSKK